MANRSDFQSAYPRSIKRLLSLSPSLQDPHRHGEVKRLFMKAHKWHQEYKNKSERIDTGLVTFDDGVNILPTEDQKEA